MITRIMVVLLLLAANHVDADERAVCLVAAVCLALLAIVDAIRDRSHR